MIIDSFDASRYSRKIIDTNEDTRGKWDIDESTGFTFVPAPNGKWYAVHDRGSNSVKRKTAEYLARVELYTYALKERMARNTDPGSVLFVVTPHTFQEMPPGTGYEGMNKPKDIVSVPYDGLEFKRDSGVRAGRRHVLLALRGSSGTLRAWSSVKRLLLHELAHTMCNHVVFRDKENHEEDFDAYERLLKKIAKTIPDPF